MNVRESYSPALEEGTLTSAPRIALIVGLLLTGLGLLAFFAFAEIQHAPAFTAAQADAAPGTVEDRSVTTLIPAFWGLPIVVCAVATLSADKITGRGFLLRVRSVVKFHTYYQGI